MRFAFVAAVLLVLLWGGYHVIGLTQVTVRLCGDGPPCAPGIAYYDDVECWDGGGNVGGNGSPRPSGLPSCPSQ